MKCEQTEDRLMEYLDGKLAFREREALELHARGCASCTERISGFSEVFQLLDSWEGMQVSASFNARLERRLESESVAYEWLSRLFPSLAPLPLGKPAFALALLAVISLGAILIGYSPTTSGGLASQHAMTPVVASMGAGADELALYRDLPVLEDLDVLKNFEVLQELIGTNPSHR